MAKPKLFLHIGLGKTGTTSLQTFFWKNRDALRRRGIEYPEYGAVAGAHHLLSPYVPGFLTSVWTFIDPKVWVPELAKSASLPILLSSEVICNLDPDRVPGFAELLRKHFDTRIIVYVRRIDNMIMATYNQQIKAGTQKLRIEDAVSGIYERLRFDNRLQPWVKHFGAENVDVRAYERGQFRNGDICRDFLARTFGIEDAADFASDTDNSNPRLSFAALEYKRILNNIITDTNVSARFNAPLLDYSAQADAANSTAKFHESNLLPNVVRHFILHNHESTFQWIAKDLMKRKDGKLFFDPEPDPSEVWRAPSYTEAEFSAISNLLTQRGLHTILREQIKDAYDSAAFERYMFALKLKPFLKA